jgi:hypothetical protein
MWNLRGAFVSVKRRIFLGAADFKVDSYFEDEVNFTSKASFRDNFSFRKPVVFNSETIFEDGRGNKSDRNRQLDELIVFNHEVEF